MDETNVSQERYCPRADSWVATFGQDERVTHHCAECGSGVIYNPTLGEGPVKLVCLECLHLGR